jgi:hypothetical protein
MDLSWIAETSQGRMVGDYISTSFAGGSAHPVYAIAKALDNGMFVERAASASFDVTAPTASERIAVDREQRPLRARRLGRAPLFGFVRKR